MALVMDVIRTRIDEEYNGIDLLDSLPSCHCMKWVTIPSEISTTSPLALVIGHSKGRDILAILMRFGDKPREVRYCSKPRYASSFDTYIMLQQDDIVRLPLFAPFKYNADISKAAKRKFSIVIKWYFMLKGLLTDGTGGDFTDYCKRFYDALRKIEAGQEEEEAMGRRRSHASGAAATLEESPDPGEPRSMYPLRSGRAHHEMEQKHEQLATPVGTSVSADEPDKTSDYDKLCRYLESHNELYLLKNIPEADCVQFVPQILLPEAQPKKLFVGRHSKSNDEIYAYMRPCRNQHEINFWIESPTNPRTAYRASTEEVAKQRILHPFNKTFPKDGHNMDQADRARLTLVVKWYFIAAGLAKHFVLKETKAYPERLRSALDHIAHRMGSAAATPDSSTTLCKLQNLYPLPPSSSSSSSPLDESHIQSSLAGAPNVSPSTMLPHTAPSPRGTKRTAEDAEFEDLAKLLVEDQTLTRQVNVADQVLETLHLQRDAFLDKWNAQHAAALEKRKALEARRTDVRNRFKRQSLAVAGRAEEGAEEVQEEV